MVRGSFFLRGGEGDLEGNLEKEIWRKWGLCWEYLSGLSPNFMNNIMFGEADESGVVF